MALTGTGVVAQTNTAYGSIISNTDTKTNIVVSLDTETVVRRYFSDIPVMIQIARCESRFRHTLANGTVLRGMVDHRDVGVMQINTGYHGTAAQKRGFNLENIYDNMAYARDLYERQGTQPWSASKKCWSRTLASL